MESEAAGPVGSDTRELFADLLEAARRHNLWKTSLAHYERTWTRFLARAAAASFDFPEKFFGLFTYTVLIATITLSVCFEGQAKAGEHEAVVAEYFVGSIGKNAGLGPSSGLSSTGEELMALWKLSELDTANQDVRKQVIDIWLHTPDSLVGALANDCRGLHGAIGLNATVAAHFDSRTKAVADALVTALTIRRGGTNHDRLSAALSALAPRMDPNDAASVANALVEALENPQRANSMLSLVGSDDLGTLGNPLAAFAARMHPNEAAKVVARGASVLLKALEDPNAKNFSRARLGDSLSALAAHMNHDDAASMSGHGASVLIKALEDPKETETSKSRLDLAVLNIADALCALAAYMNAEEAARMTARGASVLLKTFENSKDTKELNTLLQATFGDAKSVASSGRLWALGRSLSALAAYMNADAASKVTARAAFLLFKALENPKETSSERLSTLGYALSALVPRMNPDDAAILANVLTKALENPQETNSDRLSSLRFALSALVPRMNPDDAAIPANVLTKALENPQETNSDRLSSLAAALSALAARLNPEDAARLADALAKALENPQETNSKRLSKLGYALSSLVPRMNPEGAANLAARGASVLVIALENPKEMDPVRLSSFGSSLSALAARINREDAASLAARGASVLVTALENPKETDLDRLWRLSYALSDLTARMNPDDAERVATRGASVLVKALERLQETDYLRLQLSVVLSTLAAQIPSARQTQLVALSNLFLHVSKPSKEDKGREDQAQDRARISRICGSLNAQELAEVLKWPLCVGEAQKLVFAELKKRITERMVRTFDGDLWQFVEQVDSLGIEGLDRKFLDQPAKRPKTKDALKELEAIRV